MSATVRSDVCKYKINISGTHKQGVDKKILEKNFISTNYSFTYNIG